MLKDGPKPQLRFCKSVRRRKNGNIATQTDAPTAVPYLHANFTASLDVVMPANYRPGMQMGCAVGIGPKGK